MAKTCGDWSVPTCGSCKWFSPHGKTKGMCFADVPWWVGAYFKKSHPVMKIRKVPCESWRPAFREIEIGVRKERKANEGNLVPKKNQRRKWKQQ